jgi:hypothetical protein
MSHPVSRHAPWHDVQRWPQASAHDAPGARLATGSGDWAADASAADAGAAADAGVAAWRSMMFGGGAKALVGIGATTERDDARGCAPRTSSCGSVGSSDNSLKRVAAYSTRSRDCPYV